MKELSIAGKATRYDEALKEAVIAHKDEDRHLKATLERIFPELKESEDERIRKAIIEHFEGSHSSMYPYKGFTKEQILAWLEKQGEHANFINKIQIGDKVTRNEDGVLVNLSQLNRVAKKDEKQGEQKQDDKVEPKFKVGDTMRTLEEANSGITDGMPVVVSIDDKYYRCNNELIAIKDQYDYEYPPMNRKQKPAEWSEEDENIKESIITGLEMLKDGASDKSLIALYNKKIEWLKSIRPQNTWKPSEEQMEALYEETQKSNRIKDDRIVSLYNDLKKLKK